MVNAIPVELDVISIRHDHDYAEQSASTTADTKQDLDRTAVCRNQNSRLNCVVYEQLIKLQPIETNVATMICNQNQVIANLQLTEKHIHRGF